MLSEKLKKTRRDYIKQYSLGNSGLKSGRYITKDEKSKRKEKVLKIKFA